MLHCLPLWVVELRRTAVLSMAPKHPTHPPLSPGIFLPSPLVCKIQKQATLQLSFTPADMDCILRALSGTAHGVDLQPPEIASHICP